MNGLTISQVSKMYDVTPRMLRHYEKLELIKPFHREGYSYRMYDEHALRQLQQIIILRKLRISLKDIAVILKDDGLDEALCIMRDNIAQLDDEIASLSKIRRILGVFVQQLDKSIQANTHVDMLDDTVLTEVVSALSLSKTNLKEKIGMDELNKAEEILSRRDSVRIVLLPPFTVASNHVIGKEPEETVGEEIDRFIKTSRLYETKPDARYFGFNHPNPGILSNGEHGYEVWVTIPDDMELPETLVKKHFDGGLYAALTISFPDFYRWTELEEWVKQSDIYEPCYREEGDEIMGGCLEEHLNWVYSSHMGWPQNGIDGQLDLLLPIKKIDYK